MIILIIVIILFFYITIYQKKTYHTEKFINGDNGLSKIIQQVGGEKKLNLISSDGLNLTIANKHFYLTNTKGYDFIGSFEDNNGLLKLKSSNSPMNLILSYDESNPPRSKIFSIDKQKLDQDIVQNIFSGNTNQNELNNLFSLQNNQIYFDPINKVVLSNDNQGNIIYLQNSLPGTPLNWNYNIFNGMTFIYNFV